MKKLLLILGMLFFASCSFSNTVLTTDDLLALTEDNFLNLRDQNLKTLPDFESLLTTEQRENIWYIDLSFNQLSAIDEGLAAFPNLKELDISKNQLGDLYIGGVSLLRVLQAYDSGLTSLAMEDARFLQYLDVAYNQLDSLDLQAISAAKNLVELQIHRNNITDISSLENLQSLKKVKLEFNNISDVSVLEKMPNLQFASIKFNNLDEETEELWTKKSQASGL